METVTETWLPIPGYEGRYDVSDQGRVRSWLPCRGMAIPRVLRPGINRGGYPLVVLYFNGKTTREVHRLVSLAFIGPLPEGQHTRHLNGNPANNALSNLVYGTISENNLDCVRHGTHHQTAKTHCPQGHPYNDANTYRDPHRNNRLCRVCTRERKREHRRATR